MNFLGEEYNQLLAKRDAARTELSEFMKAHRNDIRAEMTNGNNIYTSEQNRLQQVFNDALSECLNYIQGVLAYTKFDSSIIEILVELISYYEGVQHISSSVTTEKEDIRFGKPAPYKERVTFITPYYVSKKYMVDRGLILAREKLAMEDESLQPSDIAFYYAVDDKLLPRIDFERFPYAKDFIDRMIEYKMKYKSEVTVDVLRAVMKKFLENRAEAIELYQATNFQKGPYGTIERSQIYTGLDEAGPKLQ